VPSAAKRLSVFEGFADDDAKKKWGLVRRLCFTSFEVIEQVLEPRSSFAVQGVTRQPSGFILVTDYADGFESRCKGKTNAGFSHPLIP